LGKDSEKEKDNDSKTTKDLEKEESTATASLGMDGVKNRQKIFYELQAINSKQISDSIIPPDQYTCLAEPDINYETNSDYIKCYSCDSESKNINKCKNTPDSDSNSIIWCNSKNQKCFTKAIFNTSKHNEIISFSRGCASMSDLESSNTDSADSPSKKGNKTETDQTCIKKSNSTKACFVVCETHLCNTISDLKSSGKNLHGTSYIYSLATILVIAIAIINFH
jgi:hypothetical protein